MLIKLSLVEQLDSENLFCELEHRRVQESFWNEISESLVHKQC